MVIASLLDQEHEDQVVGKYTLTRAAAEEGAEPVEVAPTLAMKARIRRAYVICKGLIDKPNPRAALE